MCFTNVFYCHFIYVLFVGLLFVLFVHFQQKNKLQHQLAGTVAKALCTQVCNCKILRLSLSLLLLFVVVIAVGGEILLATCLSSCAFQTAQAGKYTKCDATSGNVVFGWGCRKRYSTDKPLIKYKRKYQKKSKNIKKKLVCSSYRFRRLKRRALKSGSYKYK